MQFAIVGTGISALLLAQGLVRHLADATVTLLGKARPTRPHLLSYFSDQPTPFDPVSLARWSALKVVTAEGRELPMPLGRFTYRTFRAQTWADLVRDELLASGRVAWVDEVVNHIDDDLLRPTVCAGPRRVRADWVFTNTPVRAPDFHQHFLGWELTMPAAQLDPSTATLLDFRTASAADLRFVYALPLAPDRLFVEHVSYHPCDHAAALTTWLRDVQGLASWSVVDQEGGATPLFREPPTRVSGRVVHIGVSAGLAKTSTGYALLRLWRDAEALAHAVALTGEPWVPTAPPLDRLADRFFARLLEGPPVRARAFLAELCERAPADSVLAFLDEHATVPDTLAVGGAMRGWLSAVLGSLD